MNSGTPGVSVVFRLFGFCSWLLNALVTRDVFSKNARVQLLLALLTLFLFVYVFWKAIHSFFDFVVRCLVTTAVTIGSFYVVQQAARELSDNLVVTEIALQLKLLAASALDLWSQYEAESRPGPGAAAAGERNG